MGSRERGREETTHHHDHHHHQVSSMVVRPTDSEGGGSDYEPGEVRPDNPPFYSRPSSRFSENQGYEMRAGSVSPLRPRKMDHHHDSDYDNLGDAHHGRGYAGPVSPVRQRKMDLNDSNLDQLGGAHRGRGYVDSVSPLRQRKTDHNDSDFDHLGGAHRGRGYADSVSLPRQRKMDHHDSGFDHLGGGPHRGRGGYAGSVSPLRQRNMDHHDSDFDQLGGAQRGRGYADSVSPLRQRKMDHHHRDSDFDHLGGTHRGRGYAGSVSPLRQRKMDQYHDPDFDHLGGGRGRGFMGRRRGFGRFRDFSPPFGGGRGRGRSHGRGFDGPEFEPEPFGGEGLNRNNPNVPPREGDWICSEPTCGNLNFARRAYCNNCNKLRFGSGSRGPDNSPRGNYLGPPSPHRPPPRRLHSPPMDRGPVRDMNGYESPPPRIWSRDNPREFRTGPPPPRHRGRFSDHIRNKGSYQEEDDYSGRGKFDRPLSLEWDRRGRGRDEFFHGKRGYDGGIGRRFPSPPLPLPTFNRGRGRGGYVRGRGRWVGDWRERSRSPMRSPGWRERSRSPIGGGPKGYRRGSYMGRGRGDLHGMGRGGRMDDAY